MRGVCNRPGVSGARQPGMVCVTPVRRCARAVWRGWLAMLVMIALATCAAYAQEPSPQVPRAYDVCSVKPSPANSQSRPLPATGGGFAYGSIPTVSLVDMAFGVEGFQVFGLPEWAKADRYDVECKDTESADKKEPNRQRMASGVQALLADRFRLQFHRGTRPLPVAALTVGKGGLKLAPSESSTPKGRHCGNFGPTYLKAEACSMEALASTLTGLTGEKVIDRTGVADRYDFNLEWTLDEEREPGEARRPGGLVDVSVLSAVLNEKLGVVIKRTVESTEVIFVDHIEKPSGN